jgi:hypothetical protein
MDDDISIQRSRAGLISNIRGALDNLEQNDIHTEVLDNIRSNVVSYGGHYEHDD